MSDPLNEAARIVLREYDVQVEELKSLGNHGGFSGARLWRCDAETPLCLRAWPADNNTAQHLTFIHTLMQGADGLPFVPKLVRTLSGRTWVSRLDRRWDLSDWMPGIADFHAQPTFQRLRAACHALASLHLTWSLTKVGSCPAVERRLVRASLPRPYSRTRNSVEEDLLNRWLPSVPVILRPWRNLLVSLQPCLCDVWHDHLLFDGEELTGIIDYGAVKVNHVSVDLARMLGSLVGDDESGWAEGLSEYREVRPLSGNEEDLARALDRTGVIIGLLNWVRWLGESERRFENVGAAHGRMTELVRRMEQW